MAVQETIMVNLRTEQKGNRTMFFDTDEGDLHVATIVEQGKPKREKGKLVGGCYQWVTAHNGGHCEFFEDAEDEIREELER
jgi:hypothetical protein